MGEIQATPSRQQKLAGWRRHMVKNYDFSTTLGQNLCCHQARRTCADDRDLMLLHGVMAGTCSERHRQLE